MRGEDQQLEITIKRIFNCQPNGHSQQLTIQFTSPLQQTPIFSKTAVSKSANSTVDLNCSFKVTYNSSQTHIIGSIFGWQEQERMTFLIDLQKLKEQRMLFVREEEGVRLVQINAIQTNKTIAQKDHRQKCLQPKNKSCQNGSVQTSADTFIAEKQKLIGTYKNKSSTRSTEKDQFCSNIYSLLQQARHLRKQIQSGESQSESGNRSESNRNQQLVKAEQYQAVGSHQLSLRDLKIIPSPSLSNLELSACKAMQKSARKTFDVQSSPS